MTLFISISILLATSSGERTRAQESSRDSVIFQKLLDTVGLLEPLVSDQQGAIEPAPDRVSFDPIDGIAADFGFRVSFQPASASDGPWDFGLAYRVGSEGEHFRFVVDSAGRWNASVGSASPQISGDGLAISSGGTLALFAIGDIGYVGIGDEFLTTVELTEIANPGGFATGSGFSADTGPDAAVVAYDELAIWSFDEVPEKPGGIPRSVLTEQSAPADILEAGLRAADQSAPVFGPQSGSLDHSAEQATIYLAGVDLDDSVIRAECLRPSEIESNVFDCGVLFRVQSADELFRLVIVSDMSWWLLDGSNGVVDSGIISSGDLNDGIRLDVLIESETSVFAVNGLFVEQIELGESPGSGDIAVGTGFFSDTYSANASTPFEAFSVWPIVNSDGAVGADAAAGNIAEFGDGSTNSEYESPRFGYEVVIPDGWAILESESSQGMDYLAAANGVVSVEVFGFGGTETPQECVEFRISTLERDGDIADSEVIAESATSDAVYRAIVEYEDPDNVAGRDWKEIWCARVGDASLVRFEQTAGATRFAKSIPSQIIPVLDLILPDESSESQGPSGEQENATPEALPADEELEDPLAEVETTESAREAVFSLDGDGVEGFGVVLRVQRTVDISAVVAGATSGDVLVIRPGTCEDGLVEIEAAIRIDEIDDQGLASANVDIRLTELVNVDPFVAEVYASEDDDLESPLACAPIEAR